MATIDLIRAYMGKKPTASGRFLLKDEYENAALKDEEVDGADQEEIWEDLLETMEAERATEPIEMALASADKSLIKQLAEACEYELLGRYIYKKICEIIKPGHEADE